MGTTQSESDSRLGEFAINTQLHGYADGPKHVHIEINPAASGTFMVIVATGVDGRYSFDFEFSGGNVEIQQAYVEGMCESVGELPNWIDCVRERFAKEMEV